jgi:hypothetical protein
LINAANQSTAKGMHPIDDSLSQFGTDAANAINQPLELWNWSGVNYTAGHANNTLDVYIRYTIIDVS